MATEFQYTPLDTTKRAGFRLLDLLPGDESAVIECILRRTSGSLLSGTYEAVSYTWGRELVTETILVNGRPFKVTPNLASALRSFLRSADSGKW